MQSIFTLNSSLIEKARGVLFSRRDLYWVLGGACSGKTTLCKALSALTGIPVYDMDAQIYGEFIPRYTLERHPASTAWFTADNPLGWILSLGLTEYDQLNRAANAEYLDLMADDFSLSQYDGPWIVDGGFTHPSVVLQVVPPSQILTLEASNEITSGCWEMPERVEMKQWIMALPEPEKMWAKFLACDALINETISTESKELGIPILQRQLGVPVESLVLEIAQTFSLSF